MIFFELESPSRGRFLHSPPLHGHPQLSFQLRTLRPGKQFPRAQSEFGSLELISSSPKYPTGPHPITPQTWALRYRESDKLDLRVKGEGGAWFPGPNPGDFDHHSSTSFQLRVMTIKGSSITPGPWVSLLLLAAGEGVLARQGVFCCPHWV